MSDLGIPQWQDLFNQHQSILRKHLDMLSMMHLKSGENAVASAILQACLEQTESMNRSFQESTEAFLSERLAGNGAGVSASFSTSIFAQEQSKPANPQQASSTPVLDPSGLFTIDSNPTPPDQLFGAKHTGIYDNNPTVNGKRKAPTADEHFPESDFVHLNELPIHKRPRGDTRTGDEDDSFLREVEAQHKAKEEKRQNKTNKKRKRDSGDSFSGQPNGISQKAIGKRERKKLRKNPPQAKSKSAKGGKFFQGNSKKRGTTNGNTNGSSENNGHSKKKRKK